MFIGVNLKDIFHFDKNQLGEAYRRFPVSKESFSLQIL